MAKAGRPKKKAEDLITYQLVAMRKNDYLELKRKLGESDDKVKIADVLGKLVRLYDLEALSDIEFKQ